MQHRLSHAEVGNLPVAPHPPTEIPQRGASFISSPALLYSQLKNCNNRQDTKFSKIAEDVRKGTYLQ
jgi:formate dehydrogenase maturation protein FdhE